MLALATGCGSDAGSADAAADQAPDLASICCPIQSQTCDCFATGGSRSKGCHTLCDAIPNCYVAPDENGCPTWHAGPGGGSCLPWTWDLHPETLDAQSD